MLKSEAALVTGASGLLGQAVIEQLSDSYQLHAVVRKAPKKPTAGVNFIVADLRNTHSTKSFPKNINHVIHLAQSRRYQDGPDGSTDVVEVNVSSTVAMLEYAKSIRAHSFVFASSGGVCKPSFAVKTEASPIRQIEEMTPYFASKILGEALANTYNEFLAVKTLRFFFIYSPLQLGSGLIGRLRSQIQDQKPLHLAGSGPLLNPIHVADAARAVQAAILHKDSLLANVAGTEIVRLRTLVEHVGHQLGVKPIVISQGRPTESLVGDPTRMHRLLCTPQHALREAFDIDTSERVNKL